MLQLISNLFCSIYGNRTRGQGSSGMASTVCHPSTGSSPRRHTSAPAQAAAPDRAEKALQALASSSSCHGQERDLHRAAAEVLKNMPSMEEKRLMAEQQAALRAAQQAQTEEATRLQELSLTLSNQQAAYETAMTDMQDKSISLAAKELELTLREAAVADREVRAAKCKEDAQSFCRKAAEERQVALQRAEQLRAALQAVEEYHSKELSHAVHTQHEAEMEVKAVQRRCEELKAALLRCMKEVSSAREEGKAEIQALQQRCEELEAQLQASLTKLKEEDKSNKERNATLMNKALKFRAEKMAVEQRLSASYQQREAMQDWVQSAIDERAALQEDLDTTTQELQAHKDAQAAAPADAAQPILPEIDWSLARYTMGANEPLASGAHGSVYAVPPLALKVARDDYRYCLEEEAAAAAGISHPYVCKPLFLSRHGNLLAMGVPLAQLGSLSHYLRGETDEPTTKGFRRMPLSRQIGLMQQLADALQHCHTTLGIVHLDVKPDNILMTSPDTLQLTDFGCVRKLQPDSPFVDHSAEEFTCQPFLCPTSAGDEACSGVRDDIWGFFITAAALLLPVAPFERVFDRFIDMSEADRAKLCERLQQERISPEKASHAWYQFLHLQLTDEDFSVRQELSVKEIRRVFQDTGFPLIAPYLDFISAGLDPERYRGGCWPLAQPESLASAKDAWADINEQLDSCRQLALMAESALGINAEQEPLYGSFEVSPQGQALWLCPE